METGEIVDTSSPPAHKTLRTTSITKYVGIETKWPSECLTVDHLMESLSQIDHYVHNKPKVDYLLLNEHLLQKSLTQEEWVMLQWLCHNLSGWNYWIGDVSALDQVPRPRRAIAALIEKGLIRLLHKDKPFRGNRVFLVHPVVAWKGGYFYQNNAVQRWYV